MPTDLSKAETVFRRHAGTMRTRQALAAGIHPRTLYALRDEGKIEALDRGLYRLTDMPALGQPDLVVVAAKIPAGVICLISVLAFHEITTQVPHEVFVALPKGAERPRLKYPPIQPVWLSGKAYSDGIQQVKLDGIPVRVYGISKTLADCFKFRNRIGLEVCLEALKLARQRRKLDVDELMRFARICRVEKVVRPYVGGDPLKGGTPKNMAASVHQRLLNEARRSGRPFNQLLQYFAMERFLYRLSVSPHAKKFVLKGAMMLRVWNAPLSRPTMDIDLLGRTANQMNGIIEVVRRVCEQPVGDDGLQFDAASVVGQSIAKDAEYEGVRITFRGTLGKARISMQIDIGFGDVVRPAPVNVEVPALLDFPPPKLEGYTRETTIAEKFHAMAKRAILNTRMKDFFDLWLLSRQFDFSGAELADAIRTTFANRESEVPAAPIALTLDFAKDAGKAKQWAAFLRKLPTGAAPSDFEEVIAQIALLLRPVAAALYANSALPISWQAPDRGVQRPSNDGQRPLHTH